LYVRVVPGFFERLVTRFYDGVAADAVLTDLYPDAPDFSGARRRLTAFLEMYWGGPTNYLSERGHPRLRLRHMPFPIGVDERDRWLTHMRAAVSHVTGGMNEGESIALELMSYFEPAADQLRNDHIR
jgi:hemoglobin